MDEVANVKIVSCTNSKFIKPFRMNYTQKSKPRIWDCCDSHDSVSILIHNIDRDVFVFVRQFRAAVFAYCARESQGCDFTDVNFQQAQGSTGLTLELCAGIVDKSDSVELIACDEVLEECGYKVDCEDMHRIGSFRNVGITGSRQYLFYTQVTDAQKVGTGGGNPDEGEMIEVVEMPINDSLKYILESNFSCPAGFGYAIMWYHHMKPEKKR